MNTQDIEQAIKKLLHTPDLSKKIDRKIKYDLLNEEKRNVSLSKKLLALYDAGMLQIQGKCVHY